MSCLTETSHGECDSINTLHIPKTILLREWSDHSQFLRSEVWLFPAYTREMMMSFGNEMDGIARMGQAEHLGVSHATLLKVQSGVVDIGTYL